MSAIKTAQAPPRGVGVDRPSWDEYFMSITALAAERSTCLRRRVGAVAVKDKRILATGYNGAPSGLKHCLELGCLREAQNIPSGQRHELCRAIHAEQNVIVQAARYGISIAGATVYTTTYPCVICTKLLINSGVVRICYQSDYADELSSALLEEAGIEVIRLPGGEGSAKP